LNNDNNQLVEKLQVLESMPDIKETSSEFAAIYKLLTGLKVKQKKGGVMECKVSFPGNSKKIAFELSDHSQEEYECKFVYSDYKIDFLGDEGQTSCIIFNKDSINMLYIELMDLIMREEEIPEE